MTQEEKAKAYDEALERARKLYNSEETSADVEIACENIFPELKESEDERIRKRIIHALHGDVLEMSEIKEAVDWLEKQGETFTKKDVEDAYLQGVCDAKQELEKQGEPFDDNIITRDDEILQAVSIGLTDAEKDLGWSDFGGLPIEEIHAWLEKQGEQKHHEYTLEQAAGIFLDALSNTPYNNKPITDAQFITKELLKFLEDASSYNPNAINEQAPTDKVEPKFKVKYAGNEYNVFETKDIAGVTFYGIEDEPNHIDYVKAENCEIISVYAIKENGSPYPTKPAVFSEKKPKRMISAEAKEAMYDKPACIGRNDTLLDLLHKMPSCITVDGIDYHFVLKKTVAYMAFYEGEGEGSGKVIFWMAGDPVDLLTAMLEKLKKEGLLE